MKKTILAIHGAGMHAGIWGGIAPHLLDYYFRPAMFPEENAPSSIAAMADSLRPKVVAAEPASLILLGHSMGALVALELANEPAVAAVVLLGAAAEMPVNADLLKTARENPPEAMKLVAKWSIFPGNPQAEAMKAVTVAVMQSAPAGAIGNDLAACNDYKAGAETARKIEKPVLVISGADDKMARAEAGEALAALMPKGAFFALSSCGHMPMLENPLETALEIKRFLGESGIGKD